MIFSKRWILKGLGSGALLAVASFGALWTVEQIQIRNTPLVGIYEIREALEDDDVARATLYCKKRILADPEDVLSRLLLGECLEKRRKFDKAIKIYERAAEKAGEEPLPYFYLGRARYRNGETETAVADLKRFKDLSARHLTGEARKESLKQGSSFLAMVYMEYTKEYKKAVLELSSFLELAPEDSQARYELGTAYAYSGQYQSAYREFQRIVDENPGTDIARYAENAIQYVRERRNPGKSQYVVVG